VERFSRNLVLRRKFPSHFGGGIILVSPGIALKFWAFNVERVDPLLFRAALELVKMSDVVWDVGASGGLFSFASSYLAGSSGKVLSIEPDTFSVSLLRRSARARDGRGAPVIVLPVAVLDSVDFAEFMIVKRGRAANFLKESSGSTQTGGIFESKLVMTVTLDWLLDRYPAPNVLKIDVEGAEEKVLTGAKKVLSTVKPIILCEVQPQNSARVSRILKEYGYTIYDAETAAEKRESLDSAPYNTLAFPPLIK